MIRKKKRRLRFETLEQRNLLTGDISLIRFFDTWAGSTIASTDPAGITYHSPTGRLILADSEIDELPQYFVGNNLFEISTNGSTVYRRITSNNLEPTGITYNNFDGYFYVSNDDTKQITRYNGNLNSPLAFVDTRTATPNANDPEDIAADPTTGMLYVADGHGGGRQVLVYNSNLVFQYRFSIANQVQDGEGIAFDPISRNLFVVSSPDMAVFEYTTNGQFIQSYDLSWLSPQPLTPQGLVFAPTSNPTDDPAKLALYIADGMKDNSPDGRVFETLLNRNSDLQTFTVPILAGSDDVEERSNGSMALAGGNLALVNNGGNQAVGLRFTGINLPRGASIQNAYVQFTTDSATSDPTTLFVQGQAIDSAPAFTSVRYDVSSRTRTTSSVMWSPLPWTTVEASVEDQRTSSLAPILQELVNRPGWSAGNALALIVTGSGLRNAEAYEAAPNYAARLRVQYRVLANSAPQVSAGPDQIIVFPTVANLDGTVTDDGHPNPVTTNWSTVSGPGTVTFGNPNTVDTTASFSQLGTYVLRLAAFDGALSTNDDVSIQVTGAMLNARVAASSDDAEEKATGTMVLAGGDLVLVFDESNQIVGLRFAGINIPRGATIVNAYVQFQVDDATSVSTSLLIQGQAIDNAPTFTTVRYDMSSRVRASAAVNWTPPVWPTVGVAGLDQRTPSIASIVQQTVNRSGWNSGNALVLLITGSGQREAESYDGVPAAAPLLHVEFVANSSSPAAAQTSSMMTPVSAKSMTSPTILIAAISSSTSSAAIVKQPKPVSGAGQHTEPPKPVDSRSSPATTQVAPNTLPSKKVTGAQDLLSIDTVFGQLGKET